MTVKYVGIAGLKKELAAFEKKYGMSTETFLKKVHRGELDECNDFIDWLGLAEGYQHKHISKQRVIQLKNAPKLIDVIEEALRYMF
jgi:hypothetical protein